MRDPHVCGTVKEYIYIYIKEPCLGTKLAITSAFIVEHSF